MRNVTGSSPVQPTPFYPYPPLTLYWISSLVRSLVLSVSFQHKSIPCGNEHIIEKRLLLPFKRVTKRS